MEDNVKTDLKEMGREGVDWIDQARYRYFHEHSNETLGSVKCREFLD